MKKEIEGFEIREWSKYGKKRIYFSNNKKGGAAISFYWDCDAKKFNTHGGPSNFIKNLQDKIKKELGL